jgi:transposase
MSTHGTPPVTPFGQWLSIRQAAAYVGRSEETVRRWIIAGELPDGVAAKPTDAHNAPWLLDRAMFEQWADARNGCFTVSPGEIVELDPAS